MSQHLSQPLASFNHDRMAAFSAFRTSTPAATPAKATPMPQQDTTAIGQAAHALPQTPAPKPTQLNDNQAELALEQVQDNAQDMLNVHNGIDPERVARLLSMLE